MDNRQRKNQGIREQERRDMPRRAGTRQKGRERRPFGLTVICMLLVANMAYSLHLQVQISDMTDMLGRLSQGKTSDQTVSSASVSGSSQGWYGSAKDPQTVSGKVQDSSSSGGDGKSYGAENGQIPSSGGVSGKSPGKAGQDYVELCGLEDVGRPVKRNDREVLQRLKELSRDNELIKEIYDNADAYSGRMLEALANNPEMADFAAGYPTARKVAQGGFTDSEKAQEFPLFLQWDPRWGYVEYGDDGSIGLAGCGPTCLSMVCWYLLEDETLTPDFIAQFSMENGYYVWGAGTAWALLEEFPAMYGVEVGQPGINERQMKAALDQGCVLICSMSPGDFTTGGHFIVIYGYDKDGFKVNDSNCVARSRRSWSFEEIGDQIKQVWSYGFGGGAEYRDLYDAAG